jgi:hypothetical protein
MYAILNTKNQTLNTNNQTPENKSDLLSRHGITVGQLFPLGFLQMASDLLTTI